MRVSWAFLIMGTFLLSCKGGGSAPSAPAAKFTSYILDAGSSQVSAAVIKNEKATVTVNFPGLSGGLDLDPKPGAEIFIDLSAQTSGDAVRDSKVRDLFFQAGLASFKHAVFSLGSVDSAVTKLAVGKSQTVNAEGQLSLHGANVKLSGPLTISRSAEGYSAAFKDSWTVNINDAGMQDRLKILNEQCPQPHNVGVEVKLTGILVFKKA